MLSQADESPTKPLNSQKVMVPLQAGEFHEKTELCLLPCQIRIIWGMFSVWNRKEEVGDSTWWNLAILSSVSISYFVTHILTERKEDF